MPYSKNHLIDCLVKMREMPDFYYNLAVVDPPYGINAPNMQMGSNPNRNEPGQYPGESVAIKLKKGRLNQGAGKLKDRNIQKMNISWDYSVPSPEYFKELFRISRNQVIFGGNYFDLPPTRGIICWDKQQPWDNFFQFELAWTSFDFPAKMFRFSNRGGANQETKIHPTQKPVELYKFVFNLCGKPGDKIFDSHCGSGSSRIAAYDLGFDFESCEIEEEYFNKEAIRFAEHIAHLNLFESSESILKVQDSLF